MKLKITIQKMETSIIIYESGGNDDEETNIELKTGVCFPFLVHLVKSWICLNMIVFFLVYLHGRIFVLRKNPIMRKKGIGNVLSNYYRDFYMS